MNTLGMCTYRTGKVTFAGLWVRSLAYLIDCVIVFVIFAVTQLLIFRPLRSALGIDEEWFHSGLHTELYTLLTISLPTWLYFSISEYSRWQATVGKRLLNLRVVTLTGLGRINFQQSILRTLIKLLPWEIAHLSNNLPTPLRYASTPEFRIGFIAVGILMGVYAVMVVSGKKKRALHDLLAGTAVLKK